MGDQELPRGDLSHVRHAIRTCPKHRNRALAQAAIVFERSNLGHAACHREQYITPVRTSNRYQLVLCILIDIPQPH